MYESFSYDDEGWQQSGDDNDESFPYDDEEAQELVDELTETLNEYKQVDLLNLHERMTAFEEMEAQESKVLDDEVAEALADENKHLDKYERSDAFERDVVHEEEFKQLDTCLYCKVEPVRADPSLCKVYPDWCEWCDETLYDSKMNSGVCDFY